MKSILPIDKAEDGLGGGKARGLALLRKWGFSIPVSYLVVDYDESELGEFAQAHAGQGPWAVRSSAASEDGKVNSFAGQYETFLDVDGAEGLKGAVRACFDSMESGRAKAYSERTGANEQDERMFVVLQQMVHPLVSGALFSADPVSGRRDKLSLSLTRGVSDELMSGKVDGENLQVFKAAAHALKSSLLDEEDASVLMAQGMEIERRYAAAVDLEFALDSEHKLWWLQLRPITGLDEVQLNELDDTPLYSNPIYTRGNIGEMMPGPVTPLTMSTFGRAIDWGLQRFYQESGALDEIRPDNLFVHSYYNHLFMDLNSMYIIAKKVILASKDNVDYSIIGRKVDSEPVGREVSVPRGLINFVKSYRFVNGARDAETKLRSLEQNMSLGPFLDAGSCFEKIDENLQSLLDAYLYHYIASAQSGWYFAGILRVISGGKEPTARDNEVAAGLFTNISGIESAQVLAGLDALAKMLASEEHVMENFIGASLEKAERYLTESGPDEIRDAWRRFVQRHGHRCVREAELWEKEWALDPAPVLESLRMATRAMLSSDPPKPSPLSTYDLKSELGPVRRLALKMILPKARKAVARRERTKSLAILVQHKFKLAYRALSSMMFEDGLLKEADDIFFLSHDELGNLIEGKSSSLKETASKRRKLYGEMLGLDFEDLYFGVPHPMEEQENEIAADQLNGTPVSRGIAMGRVRLVRSSADARLLERGEIMVARYTDVGWTPYYSIISGLVTEIGSPLSHGAVVAREYGLPTVVGMKHAMSTLEDGQMVRLDAIRGRLELLDGL